MNGVNALSGLISFLRGQSAMHKKEQEVGVNALSGLISFLRLFAPLSLRGVSVGVNALSGLISFLQYPLKTLINTGFPGSFLQVFVRIF